MRRLNLANPEQHRCSIDSSNPQICNKPTWEGGDFWEECEQLLYKFVCWHVQNAIILVQIHQTLNFTAFCSLEHKGCSWDYEVQGYTRTKLKNILSKRTKCDQLVGSCIICSKEYYQNCIEALLPCCTAAMNVIANNSRPSQIVTCAGLVLVENAM